MECNEIFSASRNCDMHDKWVSVLIALGLYEKELKRKNCPNRESMYFFFQCTKS